MEIISDIPLRRVLGRDFSAIAYFMDSFFLTNAGENKVYKCDLSGNFLCSYNTRVPLSAFCFDPEEGCFIGVSSDQRNRILFYDSAFSLKDVCYLPLEFCGEERIEFVKYDGQKQLAILKKGDRWLVIDAKTDGRKISCHFSCSPDAMCNLTAVCCQAIISEKIDVLSGSLGDGSYYDLTLPPGYTPLDLCIVELGTDVIIPALIIKTPDGTSRLILCRIAKEYGHFSSINQSTGPKIHNDKLTKVTVTLSQLLFSQCEITFTIAGENGPENNQLLLPDALKATYLDELKKLLYLND